MPEVPPVIKIVLPLVFMSNLRVPRRPGWDLGDDSIYYILGTSTCHTYRMETMIGDVLNPECPSRLVLTRLGDKWTMLIVIALSSGVHRFSELRDRIAEVTPKVLTQSLRALERDGLVDRTVYAVVPPKVEYRLTELGQSLLQPIAAVQHWAEHNYGAIVKARHRADSQA